MNSFLLTPQPKPKTSCMFHVVAKARGIYGPVATVMEMPPDEESWSNVSGEWVAHRSRLIYEFLANKDPKSRCKLQAEVDLAIEQNTHQPCWFRQNAEQLSNGPNTVEPRIRAMAMQKVESIRYPYTTFGISNCLKGPGTLGVYGDDVSLPTKTDFWTWCSLKTYIELDAKYTIVVFDITDLNNIAYAVLVWTRSGRIQETMKGYCAYERAGERGYERGASGASNPVISFFDGITFMDSNITQMFLENEQLYTQICKHVVPTLSSIFEHHRPSILGPKFDGKTVDAIFGDDVRLASITELTCRDVIILVRSASKIVSLSIPSVALYGAETADLDFLVTELVKLPSLAVVYIAEPVLTPESFMLQAFIEYVVAQSRFFERVLLQSEELWKKVHGSSMYYWKLNDLLRVALDGPTSEALECKVSEHFK